MGPNVRIMHLQFLTTIFHQARSKASKARPHDEPQEASLTGSPGAWALLLMGLGIFCYFTPSNYFPSAWPISFFLFLLFIYLIFFKPFFLFTNIKNHKITKNSRFKFLLIKLILINHLITFFLIN